MVAVAVAVLVGAQPVSADTEIGHVGVVGAHSLRDTSASPGATCNYIYKSQHPAGKLVEIVVRPPRMRAVDGRATQTVGWKFTVQRRVAYIGGASDWVARYTSPEMTAVTDPDHDAAFSSASVSVSVGYYAVGGIYQYRVLVAMLWHEPGGAIEGKARHRVDYYRMVLETGQTTTRAKNCEAWWNLPQ